MQSDSGGGGWAKFGGPALLCVLLSFVSAAFLLAMVYFWVLVLPVFLALVTCVAAGYLWRGDKVRAAAAVLTIPCTAAMTAGGWYLMSLL